MMKATIWELSQRVSGWCELTQEKNLSTFGVCGESHGVVSLSIRLSGRLSGNMGGNAEDIAFRPIHAEPFCVYEMKGFCVI